jgi:hypothetical protein
VSEVFIIAFIVSISLVLLQTLLLPGTNSYLDQLSLITFKTILINLDRYVESLFVVWENGYSKNLALSVIIFGLSILGYLKRIRDGIRIFEVFTLFYVTVILVWPVYQSTRFLIPLIPIHIFYAVLGIFESGLFQSKRAKRTVLLILFVLLLASYWGKYSKLDFGPLKGGVERKESIELFNFIKRNTRESDVMVFLKPRVLALYTGRRASVYHWPRDAKDLLKYFHSIGATHLIIRHIEPAFMKAFIKKYQHVFRLIYRNKEFEAYSIHLPLGLHHPDNP